jgi:hypothetical protein
MYQEEPSNSTNVIYLVRLLEAAHENAIKALIFDNFLVTVAAIPQNNEN